MTESVGHINAEKCACGYVTLASIPTTNINTEDGSEIVGDRFTSEYYSCTVSVNADGEEYDLSDVSGKVKVRGNFQPIMTKSLTE